MERVKTLVAGRPAMVDADMVKKLVRKDLLVATVKDLQAKLEAETDTVCRKLLTESIDERMGQLIRLKRTIRPCVQFL
jgi:hypothetical protein